MFLVFKTGAFSELCDFSNLFLSNPLQFLQETKSFASIEDYLGFSAPCDIPETFFGKNLQIFSQFFVFRFFATEWTLKNPKGRTNLVQILGFSGTVEENT